MLDLILCVLFTSLLYVIFKLFTVYKVQTLYAIIINYFTAALVGFIYNTAPWNFEDLPEKSWFWGTLGLGILFILVFNVLAKTSQRLGVSVASVASKMSLVIPVLFGLLLYNESLSALQFLGIVIALIAVYFASVKERTLTVSKSAIFLPLTVFFGSGLIDAGIKYLQETAVPDTEYSLFSSTVFVTAGMSGLVFILIRSSHTPLKFNARNVIGGVLLGIPNFFTIYFLLRALRNPAFSSAMIFTLINVAIVLFSTVLGILIFKEKVSPKNWIGIFLAVISIVMVALF